jgi:hypothetical protein
MSERQEYENRINSYSGRTTGLSGSPSGLIANSEMINEDLLKLSIAERETIL